MGRIATDGAIVTSDSDDRPQLSPSEIRRGKLALAAFLLGNGVSLVGNTLTLVAIPWFVLQTTGSATQTGLTGMMAALPSLVAGVLGGAVIDRIGGRRMSVISDVISGVALLLIPLLHSTVGLAFWQLLVLVFAGAALDIPGLTARRTLLPELTERSGTTPDAVNSSFETMQGAAFIVGPAIAGLLVGWIGAVNLLWITASTFAFSAVMIGVFSPSGKHVREDEASTGNPLRALMVDVRAGLQFLRTDSLLLSLAVGLTLMNLLLTPFWWVVLPHEIEAHYGDAARFGVLLTLFGVGNLAGGILYGMVGPRVRAYRRLIYLVGIGSLSAVLWALSTHPPYWVLVVVVGIAGFISGPVNPLLVTVRFERIPKHLRGRVFATFSALSGAATPVGMVLVGWLVDAERTIDGLIAVAVLATIFTVGLVLCRPYREMNDSAGDVLEPQPGD